MVFPCLIFFGVDLKGYKKEVKVKKKAKKESCQVDIDGHHKGHNFKTQ